MAEVRVAIRVRVAMTIVLLLVAAMESAPSAKMAAWSILILVPPRAPQAGLRAQTEPDPRGHKANGIIAEVVNGLAHSLAQMEADRCAQMDVRIRGVWKDASSLCARMAPLQLVAAN